MRLHPYAIILGLALAFFVLLTLRHPPFAVLTAILGVLGFDILFKNRAKNIEDKKNEDDDKEDDQ